MSKILLAMAKAEAEFDRRPWLSMPRGERRRYLERMRMALAAAVEVSDPATTFQNLAVENFCDEEIIEEALNAD
ncbi:hypothetical protein SAMN03159496_04587 [Rhizobium sp. NFR07]|uniref:hypothetical protein n=1 Tax=Rhizobium sp. NFR07 TaxID=1566262 RepID=UPI0008E32439|nr:hypothetical protein [Rhizobium sp. NFR07]SFB52006.1 hypothetical protein SAMN03159496_04587 [Rhizobium sp. NFR07]